jgi:hypothetical protein
MSHRVLAGVSGLCLAVAASCASGPGARHGGSPFPSRAQVDALTNGSGAINPLAQETVDAERWTFGEPAARELRDERYVPDDAWGKLLGEYVATDPSRLLPTRAMDCGAREMARFYLAYSAMPATPLSSAMVERCGALATDFTPTFVFGAASPEQTDEMIHHAWQSQARKLLYDPHRAGQLALGLAFARDDKKAVVVLAVGVRKVELEPVSRTVDAQGQITVRGRLLEPAARLLADVNQGRFGFAPCERNPDRALPEFGFTCTLGPGDQSARIVISTYQAGRLLGRNVVELEALRARPSSEYVRLAYTDPVHVRTAADLPKRLLGLVNEVRRQDGLGAVSLAEDQSATATELAPRYFQAFFDSTKADELEVITLGLMAGWNVKAGVIHESHFTSAIVGPTDDAGAWLSAMMCSPSGRAVVVDPSARVMSFGALLTQSPALLGATVTSYSFFDSKDDAQLRKELIGKITAARAERGQPAPSLVTTLDGDGADLAEQLVAGRATPTSALDQLLQTGAKVLGRSVRGFVFSGGNLGQFQVPEEFLTPKRLELSITVTHYQPADSPWGEYVVLFVIPGEGTRA